MIQESITKQIINLVLATTRKALSRQTSLSIFLAMGMDVLTPSATTMKPKLWLFQYLKFIGQVSNFSIGAGCWLQPCRALTCSVHVLPHVSPMILI